MCTAEDTETDYDIGGGSDNEDDKEDEDSRFILSFYHWLQDG